VRSFPKCSTRPELVTVEISEARNIHSLLSA
jgi:hypothetical protein